MTSWFHLTIYTASLHIQAPCTQLNHTYYASTQDDIKETQTYLLAIVSARRGSPFLEVDDLTYINKHTCENAAISRCRSTPVEDAPQEQENIY